MYPIYMRKTKDFEVLIFGEIWTVVFEKLEGSLAGLCDGECRTIRINTSIPATMRPITFFHELFHAYIREAGIYNAELSHDLEEVIADQFAKVLTDNFDFKF